jgi:ubiquinone/menaquinone biosynthesis C-methylase UbiE
MNKEVKYITSLHTSTKRKYLERMADDKVHCMKIAKKYDENYWDGNRRYGYGGYKFIKDRWKPVAEMLIKKYNLTNASSVFDIGCGKAFLLYEIKELLPGIKIYGCDISKYGLENAKVEIKNNLFYHDINEAFEFNDKQFDLSFSINALHNIYLYNLPSVLKEIERISKESYICIESYRNELELFNLQCWALTAETLIDTKSWKWLFELSGYKGDFEFIFFE